jgi:capsule biosynthesis phosphatase
MNFLVINMRIVFDLDGTLCSQTQSGKYHESEPFVDIIKYVNKLYDDGHVIIIQSARGMGSNCGNIGKAYNQWYSMTEKQLDKWGVKYNELLLGKPYADVYIDDRALRVDQSGKSSLDTIKRFLDGH